MQREEKALENLLDQSILKIEDLKNAIGSLLAKMEMEGESELNFIIQTILCPE